MEEKPKMCKDCRWGRMDHMDPRWIICIVGAREATAEESMSGHVQMRELAGTRKRGDEPACDKFEPKAPFKDRQRLREFL